MNKLKAITDNLNVWLSAKVFFHENFDFLVL